MRTARPLGLVTAIGRRIDRSVCNGSVANAARSVHLDRERADQRREAWLAMQEPPPALRLATPAEVTRVRVPAPRRTG